MQNDPVPNGLPQIADLVISDIESRRQQGIRTYGVPLQPLNGRRALQDLYEELLDAAHYTRQRLEEEDLALTRVTDDPDAAVRIQHIKRRAREIDSVLLDDQRGGVISELVDGSRYLARTIDRLLAGAGSAPPALDAGVLADLDRERGAIPGPAAGPGDALPLAGYQYRANHADGPSYDDCYTEEYCADIGEWAEGYWPEFRPLYGGPWVPVGPQGPPEQPLGGWTVPKATGDDPVSERVPEGLPEAGVNVVIAGTDDGRLRVHCPACEWDAVYACVDLVTIQQVVDEHATECRPPVDPQDPPEVLLGSVLRQIRRGCDLTVDQLTERLKHPWTRSRLFQVENSWVPVTDYEVADLCEALGVETPELCDRLYRLAALSRTQTKCPGCEHAPSAHTWSFGCVRCTCAHKR